MVVIGKLMKLTSFEIMYAIGQNNKQTGKINNPTAYMLTLLYHAKEQMHLDVTNQVRYDMSGHGADRVAESMPSDSWGKSDKSDT